MLVVVVVLVVVVEERSCDGDGRQGDGNDGIYRLFPAVWTMISTNKRKTLFDVALT